MSIQRWEPFRDTLSLRDALGRLLEESVVWPATPGGGAGLGPALDLEESPDAYTVRAALPGFRPEEVDVSLLGDTLTIQAARTREEERQERQYLIRERQAGAVRRTIVLPGRVDADRVQSRYEHGELVLTLPKTEESKPRRIAIGGQGRQRLPASSAYQYGYDAGPRDRARGRALDEAAGERRGEYARRAPAAGRGLGGRGGRRLDEARAARRRARGK